MSNYTHDFKDSVKLGQKGEEVIFNWLSSLDNVAQVQNVTGVGKYQNVDTDFLVEFKNGKWQSIELKTDKWTSGNLFIETVSNMEKGIQGCLYKSKSEYWFYYLVGFEELYVFPRQSFIQWFETIKDNFQTRTVRNIDRTRTGHYTTLRYLVPKKFVEENFQRYKKYKVKPEDYL